MIIGKKLCQQYRNAMTIIEQMKCGEWVFEGHYIHSAGGKFFRCFDASRHGERLWVANGGFFCEIEDKPWELGIFGHLVWHFGAKQAKRALVRKMRRQPSDMSGGAA
jgi:hypothetical protein